MFVIAWAIALAGAGKLQYDAYEGDQGLGAFLRDGDGYQNSGYQPPKRASRRSESAKAIEVAEDMRVELVEAAAAGDTERARALEARLEALMDEEGMSFDI